MSRNRIIYNVEGVFVAPYSGEQNPNSDYYLNGYRILKKIEKIQNFDYSIEQPNIDFIGFGSKKSVTRLPLNSPNVSFNFSYIPDGFTNENRLNFDVANFQSVDQKPMFSGICKIDSLTDKKDFYVVINNNNSDLSSNYTLTDQCVNPSNLSDVIDPNSVNFSLLEFKNCFITDYSLRLQVGSMPVVNQSYSADDINLYPSGSGINASILDLKSGYKFNLNEYLVIPKFLAYDQTGISGQNILLPGDANVTFYNSINTGVLFYTDTLQSIEYDISFRRNLLKSLNYKFPLGRNISYPVGGTINIGFLVKENLSGSFFNTLDNNIDYNIVVNFSNSGCNISGVSASKIIFSGCKFNDINYGSSIGSNKTANLKFNFDLDPDFGTRGIFASGNVLYGFSEGLCSATENAITYNILGTDSAIENNIAWMDIHILNY